MVALVPWWCDFIDVKIVPPILAGATQVCCVLGSASDNRPSFTSNMRPVVKPNINELSYTISSEKK